MEERFRKLDNLKSYIIETDKEVTMILQTLQWDRETLIKKKDLVTCSLDASHKLIEGKQDKHHKRCLLNSNGYSNDDILLSESECKSSWKLDKHQIQQIIQTASENDPIFKKGSGHNDVIEPMTLDRLQSTYTRDERRAIHDFVVQTTTPPDGDFTDLTLVGADIPSGVRVKSRVEVLAEQRDMKRRRTKYRVAPKTKNYSDILRDVIKTQIEVYTEVLADKNKIKQEPRDYSSDNDNEHRRDFNRKYDRDETSRRDIRRSREKDEYRKKERHEHRSRERKDHSRDREEHRHVKREGDKYASREKEKDKYSYETCDRYSRSDRSHRDKEYNDKSRKDENRKRNYSSERHEDYKSSRSKDDRKRHKRSEEDRYRKRDKYYKDEHSSHLMYKKSVDTVKVKREREDI